MKKNKIEKFVIILFLVLICSAGIAQTDFRPGYIIINTNDTIHGEINYRGDFKNCMKCTFRESSAKESIDYLPYEIKAYRFIDGKYYISTYLEEHPQIERKNNPNNLSDKPVENLFLEFLIDGIVDIYHYRNSKKDYYYAKKDDSELYELKNNKKEIVQNGLIYHKNSKEYIGILKYLFNDSQNTISKVDNITMSNKSLINISKDYHSEVCKGESCIIFEKKISPLKFTLGVVIGGKMATIFYYFNKNNPYDFTYNSDYNIMFGLESSLNLSFINDRIWLTLEAFYNDHEYYSTYTDYLAYGTYQYESFLNYNSILSSLSIKYLFPRGKIRPFIYLGGSADFIISDKSKMIIKNVTTQPVTVDREQNLSLYSSSYGGYLVGVGFEFHQIERFIPFIKFDYSYLNGPGNVTNIKNIKITTGVKF